MWQRKGRDAVNLKIDLQKIWSAEGVDLELYRAVNNWRGMVQQNKGKYIKGELKDRDWPQMVDSLMPLLLGVDEASQKAHSYFRDSTPA